MVLEWRPRYVYLASASLGGVSRAMTYERRRAKKWMRRVEQQAHWCVLGQAYFQQWTNVS